MNALAEATSTGAPGTRAPVTRTVGGVRRGPFLAVAIPLAVLAVAGLLATSWRANYEPLRFDGGGSGVWPVDLIQERFDATSPRGDSFTEVRLQHEPGRRFRFGFTIDNDGPVPVTITRVWAPHREWAFTIDRVRLGVASGFPGDPIEGPPYTVPAHQAVNVVLEGSLTGCLDQGVTTSFGRIPVTFRLLGFVERTMQVAMPMTIDIVGAPGTRCPASP